MVRTLAGAIALACLVASSAHATIACNDRGCTKATPASPSRHVHFSARRHRHHRHAPKVLTCSLVNSRAQFDIQGPCLRRIEKAREMNRRVLEHAMRGRGRVCTAQGRCATVATYLVDKFQGLFRDLEALGYNLGQPGCLSGGHMRHSLHHWGGACDLFNQVARNRTALRQPPASVQIELAARHGLTAGASWCNPDGGHFDVSGYNGCRAGRHVPRRAYARASHRWVHRGRIAMR